MEHERRDPRYSEDVAHRAVKQVFAILGVDVDDPAAVEEFRKDLRFGQSMRRAADNGALAFIGVAAAALCYAIFAGIAAKIAPH